MKISRYKATFAVAAIAIAAVGMLRDPDTANADEVAAPLSQDRVPGYQSNGNVPKYAPLSASELTKLNAPETETVPTF